MGDSFKTISTHGIVRIKVMAEEAGSYKASDWSALCNDYYYIPDSTNQEDIKALQKYGLGRAYNFVEDYYIDNEQISDFAVLDPAKLLTIGSYTEKDNTAGYVDYYSYSSVDEYMSKREDSLNASVGVDIPLAGSLEIQLAAIETAQYNSYAYNEMFVTEVGVTMDDHKIIGLSIGENGADNDALVACMDKAFLADITGKTTNGLTNEEQAKIIYDKYGTHVILGVTTGGSYLAQYMISTNEESVAQTAQSSFKLNGKLSAKEFIDVAVELERKYAGEESSSSSTTETYFNVEWIGSNQGATTNPEGLDDAIAKFNAGITESTARTIRLANSDSNQTPSAIAISDLIWAVDPELAEAFEAYISQCADDSYEEMYKKYESSFVRLVGAPTVENGKNVLTVDLSAYQKGGSLESAYDPNFIDGVLKLHPVMYTKRIDKIVLRGAFDEEAKRNLIDSITVALPKEWNGRTLEIVIENLGAVATAECGILDLSAISNDKGISVSYTGINVIQGTDGLYTCYADGKAYALELKADETIDFSTASVSGGVALPVATKANYDFAGWIDGNENMVTASNGKLNTDVQFGTDVPLLSATWKPVTYKLTLNEQGATQSGTKQLYQMYGISYTLEASETEDIAKQNAVSKITIPVKTGYVFGGYYSAVPENNSTVNVKDQGEKYIDASGNIVVSNMTLTDAKTVYAKWTPAQYTIEYIGNGATEGTTAKSVHRYDVEAKLTAVGFKKEAASFGGWNTKADGTGTTYANGATVKNLTSVDGGVVKLYAIWTDNIIVTLNAPDATNNYTKNVYMTPAKDAFYSDVNCTKTITNISVPAKTGYSFASYYAVVEGKKIVCVNGEGKLLDALKAVQDNDGIQLTVEWTPNVYKITLDNQGADSTGSQAYYEKYGVGFFGSADCSSAVTKIAVPTRTGYTFAGYYESVSKNGTVNAAGTTMCIKEDGTITASKTQYSNVKTLYALWKPIQYTITYVTNESTYGLKTAVSFSKTSKTVYYSAACTFDVPSAPYYVFDGWWTAKTGGTRLTDGNGYTSKWTQIRNVTVYAHWKQADEGYTYISTVDEFKKISGSGKYALVQDIDFKSVQYSGSIIGSFGGELKGNGKSIKNLKIVRSNSSAINSDVTLGLFGQLTSTANVHDLNVYNSSVFMDTQHGGGGWIYAGIVVGSGAGKLSNIKLYDCSVEIHRDTATYGGIAGTWSSGGTISGCHVYGIQLYGNGDTGGIAGTLRGTITGCSIAASSARRSSIQHYANTSRRSVGGICGYSEKGSTISSSVSYTDFLLKGDLSLETNMGVIVGNQEGGAIHYVGAVLESITKNWEGQMHKDGFLGIGSFDYRTHWFAIGDWGFAGDCSDASVK